MFHHGGRIGLIREKLPSSTPRITAWRQGDASAFLAITFESGFTPVAYRYRRLAVNPGFENYD